jgi:acyl carrier protein
VTTTSDPTPATTELEAFLLHLWEAVLGSDGLGVDDDFFEAGGDSLLAMHVAATLSDRFGLDMTSVTPFETPTVRTLAAYVERALLERAEQMTDEEIATSLEQR